MNIKEIRARVDRLTGYIGNNYRPDVQAVYSETLLRERDKLAKEVFQHLAKFQGHAPTVAKEMLRLYQ